MPIHDWTRVDAGLFHDFHQSWTVALRNALNEGILPIDNHFGAQADIPLEGEPIVQRADLGQARVITSVHHSIRITPQAYRNAYKYHIEDNG